MVRAMNKPDLIASLTALVGDSAVIGDPAQMAA